ncbi:MAG TPA: hypothetical protein DEP53_10370 [Bacteroidetes bacterium]|nr:hypothetical protein [Bacteroidota bacterium]
MRRASFVVTIVLMSFLAFGTHGRAQESQEKGKAESARHQQHDKEEYTCPMHPDVKSEKPGKCPKCGMSLVLIEEKGEATSKSSEQELSGKEKALLAKKLLAEAKEELVYNCCLKDPCDRCALDHQSCQCNKDLRAGKGVCSDCYAGWQMGQGEDIPGITKDKVKPNFHGHQH